ncbi:esterase FE4-like isoform X1 [Schistocerca nitens]|uniref:esterase FE4-like isoform X1 n=1 Tax=Schistocerca nitens TaxID=7011 RepID=UPI002118EA20|nr:esterase FE4-like isoform X1 [Schistocerca nitens]XP_049799268.1 esterase FE4-like isoform X1 [Schistocerca nitens]
MDLRQALLLTVLFMVSAAPISISAQEYVMVDIDAGTLRGQIRTTYTNKTMYSFEGIPYAESPVDNLRFQPPVTKGEWSGVRDALQPGSACPQLVNGAASGSEDCLYLNVHSPSLTSSNGTLKAVIVWIHGGCFLRGRSDTWTPHFFVDNDVVFVSINYRLGLLGFLSTSDDVVPGNMGLKDQTEALRWVQRNIEVFGGDPERVTLLGHSAGAASAHYHILSPLSNGLYRSAISMSGSVLCPWAFSKNATDRALRFAQYLGYTAKNSSDLVNFLKTVDANILVKDVHKALSDEDALSLTTCVWTPSVEPEHESAFLVEDPHLMVQEGRYNFVPYVTGSTDLEQLSQTQPGGQLSTEEQVSKLNQSFDETIACDLRLPTREEQLGAAQSIKQFYYNDSDITLQKNYITALLSSHLFFVEGVDGAIRSMAQYSSEPLYYYQFAYNGPTTQFPGGPGAAHDDTVAILFTTKTPDADPDGIMIRDQMIEMFANFAKYDNPTPEDASNLTETWWTYSASSPFYLKITSPLSTATNMDEPYMSFWHDLLS